MVPGRHSQYSGTRVYANGALAHLRMVDDSAQRSEIVITSSRSRGVSTAAPRPVAHPTSRSLSIARNE